MHPAMPPSGQTAVADIRPRRVLVADDEADVAELIRYHLKAAGFEVDVVTDPGVVIARSRAFQPDLVILDVMMPDISGFQLCRLMRADPTLASVPVVFLTAKSQPDDRVQGLELGADDYITKPFIPKELVLRVQSILRRSTTPPQESGRRLQLGTIVVDTEHHRVYLAGREITLTATEFRLLQLLLERKGRVQSREHLLLTVWNYETEIETRTVDTHVRRLREKLGDQAGLLETVRGMGYRMVDPR
jgi:two-component system, OmpR family, phosphate regulon response regulator PhoB